MTSLFSFPGGSANPIRQIITGTGVTVISLGTAVRNHNVALFRVSEYAGGTPNLTVEIYDGTTSYFLGSGGFTWNVKALTALQSLLFDDGYAVPAGSSLRITCSVANSVVVTGLVVGAQKSTGWQPQVGSGT